MKALVLAALLVALTGSVAAGSYKSSLELNSAELTLSIEKFLITYADFDNLSVGQFSLPVRQYLIPLEKSSTISTISVSIGETEMIERLTDRSVIQSDIATSDNPTEYEAIKPSTAMDRIGQKAFEIRRIRTTPCYQSFRSVLTRLQIFCLTKVIR